MAPSESPRRAHTLHRLRLLAVCAALTALAFQQDTGLIAGDTKLDLSIDPGKFLARSLTLWDAQGFSGQLQNQAYGYLFPMGPFFWLGHLVGLPAWVVQRMWLAGLLCLAFLGMVRLAGALGCGSRTTRIIAGLAFVLTPRLMTTLGPVSIEALPMTVAPWVLLPLVLGAQRGSPRRAALTSAALVALAGGVNAAAAVAVLPLPVLWLLTRGRGPRRRQLATWWSLGVVGATLWWLGPLLVLGRYSPPFLSYIEDADVTTRFTSLVEVLRGTSAWMGYLAGPTGPSWRAGFALVSQPMLVLMSVVVVSLGLVGLSRRSMPQRGFLLLGLSAGLVLVTFGHLAAVDGVLATWQHGLLDGALAPVRNVHKYDVVLRIPLVLGLAHVLATVRFGSSAAEVRRTRVLISGTVVLAVLIGTGAPLVLGRLMPSGSAAEIPGYWRQAADYVGQDGRGRTILLPGSRFGSYLWGSLGDEPLQSLASGPWTVRNAIPLTEPGYIRVLDRVEQSVASGRADPGLATYLRREGITQVLVRNDLDWQRVGAPRPSYVHAALVGSGMRRVASFGPTVGGTDGDSPVVVDGATDVALPALEVYAVGGAGGPTEPLARTTALSTVPVVVGGPESLSSAALQEPGVSVLGSDSVPGLSGPTVLTEGLRRREVNVGRNEGSSSPTLTGTTPFVLGQPRHDYLPTQSLQWLTSARLVGVASVTATTSASDPDSPWATRPANQPFAALDGDPQTAWSAWAGLSGEPTLRVALESSLSGSTVKVTPYLVPGGPRITAVRASTDAGVRTTVVSGYGPWQVELAPGSTRHVDLTLVTDGAGLYEPVGLREVEIPGVRAERVLDLPAAPAGRDVTGVVLSASPASRTGCVVLADGTRCSPALEQEGEDDSSLGAQFTLPSPVDVALSGSVRARPGPELAALATAQRPDGVRVSASSTELLDVRAGAGAAYDGDAGTTWIASPDDPAPVLTLRWPVAHTISGADVSRAVAASGRRATGLSVDTGSGFVPVDLGVDGQASWTPVSTRVLKLRFTSVDTKASYDAERRTLARTGIAVPDVVVRGAPEPDAGADSLPVSLECGQGPTITVDGRRIETSVDTTLGALRNQLAAPFSACAQADGSLALSALSTGTHDVVANGRGLLVVDQVALMPRSPRTSSVAAGTSVAQPQVVRWGPTQRRLELPARDEPVLLSVPENSNAGWRATADGKVLQAVRVDGWAQGYVVPAGAAVRVDLDFTPQRTYMAVLLLGLLTLLLCLVGAVVSDVRDEPRPTGTARRRSWLAGVCSVLVASVLAGVTGVALVVASIVLLGLTRSLVRRRPRAGTAVTAVACLLPGLVYAGAGLLLARRPWGSTAGYAGDDTLLQVLCAVALSLVAASYATVGWASGSASDPVAAQSDPGSVEVPAADATASSDDAAPDVVTATR